MPTHSPSDGLTAQTANGFSYLLRGYHLIRQPGLRRFVLVPLSINVGIFGALVWWLSGTVAALIGWLGSALSLPGFLADLALLQGLITLLQYLLWLVFGLGMMVAVFYSFSLLANFLAAPFNSLLAEKVEKHLSGELVQGQEGWSHALKSIPHVMSSELFKLLYMAMWLVPLLTLWLLTLFIPGLNLLSTAAWLWFGAWLLSLEYADYPAGNHGLRFPQVRKLMKQHRPSAMGFGFAVTTMTSIPLLNLIAMPCAVAGATALWHDRLRHHSSIRQPGEPPHV